jgi:hypothetical protein
MNNLGMHNLRISISLDMYRPFRYADPALRENRDLLRYRTPHFVPIMALLSLCWSKRYGSGQPGSATVPLTTPPKIIQVWGFHKLTQSTHHTRGIWTQHGEILGVANRLPVICRFSHFSAHNRPS